MREASFGAGVGARPRRMESKIQAAELAAGAGIATVIASGRPRDASARSSPATRGTRFPAAPGPESAYKLWLRYGKRVDAAITVDDGARKAVASRREPARRRGRRLDARDFGRRRGRASRRGR